MKEQSNPITHLRQMQEAQTQTAAPLERLILKEGKPFRTNGESVYPMVFFAPINIPINSAPEKIGETYPMKEDRLIGRFRPSGANAYMVGILTSNYLPISYYRI